MSRTVFLHVGLPKSGTTYLQRVLGANKARLRKEAALLYPGRRWSDQVAAVQDVRRMGRPQASAGAWAALVEEIAAWSGDSIVSMEWLCAADDRAIRQVLADLAPARVEVIFTVRDLGRTLPAAWQEGLKNRQQWAWEEFLEGVTREEPQETGPGATFWAQHDVVGLVHRWAALVGADHVHVVTVPPPGGASDVLWQRVSQVLGFDAADYPAEASGSNESLGLESAELMRRLNPLTREVGLKRGGYQRVYKRALARQTLAGRKNVESRLAVPPEHHDWVTRTADRQIATIRGAGVHVVGDLEDLRPALAEGRQPADVSDAEVLGAALDGLVALGRELNDVHRDKERLEARVARLEKRLERAARREEVSARRLGVLRDRVRDFEASPFRSAVRVRLGAVKRRLARGDS